MNTKIKKKVRFADSCSKPVVRPDNFTNKLNKLKETHDNIDESVESSASDLNVPFNAEFKECQLVAGQFVTYAKSDVCKMKESIQPRCIFISLSSLWKQWQFIPFDVIFSSLMIFQCKRECVFGNDTNANRSTEKSDDKPKLRRRRSKKKTFADKLANGGSTKHWRGFQSLLLNKEKQGRLLWISPTQSKPNSNDKEWLFDPKWQTISQFLSANRDPITERFYNPINSDWQWWFERIEDYNKSTEIENDDFADAFTQLQFCNDFYAICSELKTLRFRYKPVLEIIRQSNLTLMPIKRWNEDSYRIQTLSICSAMESLRKHHDLSRIVSIDNWTHRYRKHLRPEKPFIAVEAIASLRIASETTDNDGMIWIRH